MEVSTRAKQSAQHKADRRARELYRYYQPASLDGLAGLISSWLPAGEDLPSSGSPGTPNTPPVNGSGNSNSSATSRPLTAIGSGALELGTSNSTLTAFAQLAALRLNVERAFICVLDRDMQFILAEATQSVNLNNTSVHDKEDELWLGSSGSQKAWSCCLVSLDAPYDLLSLFAGSN